MIKNNDQLSRDIVTYMQIGLYVCHLEDLHDDHSIRIVTANPAFSDLTGIKIENVIGKTLDECFPTLRQQGIPQLYANVVRTGQYDSIETTDGLSTHVFPLPNQSVGIMLHNITYQKQKETASKDTLKELADLKFALDEHSIVAITDRKGKITYVNDKFCEISKFSRGELLGKDHRIINSGYHSKHFFKDLWETIGTGKIWKGEIKNKAKDGSYYWVYTTIVPFLDENGVPYQHLAIRTDLTQQKNVEQELQKQGLQLKKQTEDLLKTLETLKKTQNHLVQTEKMAALGGLVAGVAHEINTPIGIGVTAASYLEQITDDFLSLYHKNSLKKSDLNNYLNQVVETNNVIQTNLKRASELIKSFKQVSVDQSSEVKRKFYLKQYMEEVLKSLGPNLKKTRHHITVHCPDDLEIYSFPGAFSQIITNFVMNSLLHGYDQEDEGHILFDIEKVGNHLIFKYSDNGKGISKEIQNKIFDPFFTTNRQKGGTGLGLHILHNIVTQTLGGTIKCESEAGKGTMFIISLPINEINDV